MIFDKRVKYASSQSKHSLQNIGNTSHEQTIEDIKFCIHEIEKIVTKYGCEIKPQNNGAIIMKNGVILKFI
jgi:hypothetical protein